MSIIQIAKLINDSISVKKELAQNIDIQNKILLAANLAVSAFKNNGKVLFCGNGGSAADAQHLSAELSGRFNFDREPLDSDALHCNTSYLTAIANDYSYEEIYSRLVKAKLHKSDILIGLSTSGNSKNILEAFKIAKQKGASTILLTGQNIANIELQTSPDVVINVPSRNTARIQESHIMIGHIICDLIEQELFGKRYSI